MRSPHIVKATNPQSKLGSMTALLRFLIAPQVKKKPQVYLAQLVLASLLAQQVDEHSKFLGRNLGGKKKPRQI